MLKGTRKDEQQGIIREKLVNGGKKAEQHKGIMGTRQKTETSDNIII